MANKIGRYEILDEIGRGAFGQVYRAFDPDVNRRVAVKVLNTIGDPDILARFRNEAAAAGNLNHPNIVTIYDFGEHKGVPFIVMELVDGADLQKTMSSRRLSLLEKMGIMSQVANGLHFAHTRGVIHRDVKPANIMVLPNGTVKILDFGIARLNQANAARQTRTGYLVGTILYMSPEQFQDAIVDSLCDIWAYGVVYYEMLTGKYPFEAKDNASLMYKVTRVDPPRIRTLAPDCPEALEQIVHRALSRDRELRYQSLDDLQLDADPVLADLRRLQAGGMISQARSLFEAGQLDEAQAMVRRILDLDPASAESRQLRDQISRQMQRRSVRPRVENLLKDAEREIAERRFSEATEALESAMRLDPSDSSIRVRLDESRRLAECAARAADLVAQAEREFRLQDFGGAYRLCSEALRIDEEHPQGKRLMEAIQEEIARRDRKRKLDEGLEKARGLLLIQAFDEVFATLEALRQEFPGEPQVEQLLATARARQEERERRNRLQGEIQTAKQLLKEHRFAEAVERLRLLGADFAGESQVAELLAFAEDELRRQVKEREIAGLVEQASRLAAENQLDAALKVIDQGLQKYASDSGLIRLFQSTMAAKRSFEKGRAVEEALRRAEDLRQQGKSGEALEAIEAAIARCGPEPALLKLRGQLEAERDRLRRTEEIQRQLSRAAELEAAQEWDRALASLDDALARFPDSPELASARARIQQGFDVARETAANRLQIKQALAARDWDLAACLIDAARAGTPMPELADFQQQLEAGRSRSALDALVTEVQEAVGRGDLERAEELVNQGLAQHGKQERLLRLQQFLQRENGYRGNMATARKALEEHRLDAAHEFLQKALQAKPSDTDALVLIDRIAVERETERRSQENKEVQELLVRAAQFENDGRWESALGVSDEALARYPNSPELTAARTRVQKIFQISQQREAPYRECMAAARKALEERRFDDAAESARRALEAKPEDKPALALLERIDVERQAQPRTRPPTFGDTAPLATRPPRTPAPTPPPSATAPEIPTLPPVERRRTLPPPTFRRPEIPEPPPRQRLVLILWIIVGIAGALLPIWLVNSYLNRSHNEDRGHSPPPGITGNAELPAAIRGERYTAALHASGGSGSLSWSVSQGALPKGVELDSAGRLDGTPAEEGTARFTARVTDRENRFAERAFSITVKPRAIVRPPTPLTISETWENPTATRGAHYSAALKATGGSPPILWSLARGSLPRGLAFDPRAGRIEGTPLADGQYNFVVKATDRERHSAERSFSITVRPPDDRRPPTPPPASTGNAEVPGAVRGERYTAVLRAGGGSGSLSWSVSQGALPKGVELDSSGRLDGTPSDEGTARFTARVTDREGRSAERAFSIVVQAPKKSGCVAKPFVLSQYGDSPSGTLTWSGNLASGAELRISGRRASTGSTRGDGLPPAGIPVRITISAAGIKKTQEPTAANCWISELVLHNDAQAVSSITISWTVYQP